MGGLTRTQGDETLRTLWGFPYGAWRRLSGTDLALDVALSVSFVMALVGIGVAQLGYVDPRVGSGGIGTQVTYVSPLGSAWADGIRPYDIVTAIRPSGSPGGWSMTVLHEGAEITTSTASYDGSLRNTLPLGVAGLIAAGIALMLRVRWRRGAWAMTSISGLLASVPLWVQNDPRFATLALALATLIPAAGVLVRRPRSVISVVATLALAGFLAIWAVSQLLAPYAFDYRWLEQERSTLAFYSTCALVLSAAFELRRTGAPAWRSRITSLDIALAAGVVGAFLVLDLYVGVDWMILAAVGLLLFVAYPRTRGAVLRGADALVLGDVRRAAAIKASEGERARLAADLHDVPIQELSAVISRLELVEEAAVERDALRRVASQLRAVTTELRPPVLDDLGLPLAIEALADQYAREGTAIRVDVADRTRPQEVRDPDVELAIYRVTEEAVRNAVTHADARRVDVTGTIAADAMEIEVRDDGRGLDRGALERARKAGHAGLLAMRQRAEAIGARLSLRSELGAGVSVMIAWNR
jgi:signal transduction histidine kinase